MAQVLWPRDSSNQGENLGLIALLRDLDCGDRRGGGFVSSAAMRCSGEPVLSDQAFAIVQAVQNCLTELEGLPVPESRWRQLFTLAPTVEPQSLLRFGQNIDGELVLLEFA
jgi:hypothetical protein